MSTVEFSSLSSAMFARFLLAMRRQWPENQQNTFDDHFCTVLFSFEDASPEGKIFAELVKDNYPLISE